MREATDAPPPGWLSRVGFLVGPPPGPMEKSQLDFAPLASELGLQENLPKKPTRENPRMAGLQREAESKTAMSPPRRMGHPWVSLALQPVALSPGRAVLLHAPSPSYKLPPEPWLILSSPFARNRPLPHAPCSVECVRRAPDQQVPRSWGGRRTCLSVCSPGGAPDRTRLGFSTRSARSLLLASPERSVPGAPLFMTLPRSGCAGPARFFP
jgi:hypothetical protein